jgi:hypothetical protein
MDTPERLTTGRRKTKQKHNTISGRHRKENKQAK